MNKRLQEGWLTQQISPIREGARREKLDKAFATSDPPLTINDTLPLGKHLWCGPGALAAVTGIDTATILKTIRLVNLKRYVKGVSYSEMRSTLSSMGIGHIDHAFPRSGKDCPKLGEWLTFGTSAFRTDSKWLVCITGHWIAVHGSQWSDSMNRRPRPLTDCPYLKARVRHAIELPAR